MPIPKQAITPGQGLLLLIKHYQDDSIKLKALKTLYINGANTTERSIAICDALLEEPLMQDLDILIDEASIDADPSRRYFETHLAYQSLKYQLPLITHAELQSLCASSYALVDDKISTTKRPTISQVIDGELVRPTFNKRENYQFHYYIKRIIEGSIFSRFEEIERQKLLILVRVVYLSLVNGWCSTEMPLDIYHSEQFSSSSRGRMMRDMEGLRKMRNQHFGLLKGYMPLAADDIAMSTSVFEHMKSGDYSSFDADSPVIQACFQQLVHPFSNSISGSFLVFLRVLARLHNEHQALDFTTALDKMVSLLRLSMSTTLFYSGGHSFYEYMAVLNAPEVQSFFAYLPGFEGLDLGQIFLDSNEAAFDEALQATLVYNERLMHKKRLHAELTHFFKPERAEIAVDGRKIRQSV
jgi:hypothetical protein